MYIASTNDALDSILAKHADLAFEAAGFSPQAILLSRGMPIQPSNDITVEIRQYHMGSGIYATAYRGPCGTAHHTARRSLCTRTTNPECYIDYSFARGGNLLPEQQCVMFEKFPDGWHEPVSWHY